MSQSTDRTPSANPSPKPPALLEHAGDLLQRYDVLFCDVWGVVHDGNVAMPGATDALLRFRDKGGTVILVSNAPVPDHQVARMLDARDLPRDAYDAIVSSGDIALRHIHEHKLSPLYPIGPRDRDAALFEAAGPLTGSLHDAQAILCSGLNDDLNENAESYREVLVEARSHGLPFVCANPDLLVDVGGTLYLCAGALGDLYSELGGDVVWAGKPYAVAYETALDEARRLRGGGEIERERILVIGDSVRTDLTGAANFGVDALFIASGIHREETILEGRLCADRLGDLLTGHSPHPIAAMPYLAW